MTNINKLLVAVSVIATNMVAIESLSVDDVRFDDGRQQESLTIESVDFTQNKGRQTSTYLEKVISGEIGAIYSTNSNTKKISVAMVLRYEDLFYEFIRLKLEYRYTFLNFEKKLVRRDNAPANLPSSKTVKETHSSSDLREAYVGLDLGKYADITIGRQVIVWGQFELLSPMDMLLPTDYSARTIGLLKAQNRLPQDSVVLNLYPTSKIKLSTYYFPQIQRDPLVQDFFDQGFVYNSDDDRLEIDQPDKDDEPQKAIKATYYGDSFTFGVLYYDGWEDGYTELEYLELEDRERPDQDLYLAERYMVRKVKATGFELAIPKNRWTWKIEATQQKDTIDFDPMDWNNYDTATGERRDFLSWIVNENGGRHFVPVWSNWMAIGFDYNSEKWQTNFIVVNVGEDIIGKENKRRMKQNFDLTIGDDGYSYNDAYAEPVKYQLPAIHTARYFDKDKDTALGVGLGVVGDGYKFFTYFKSTIGDSFSYGVSLEALNVETDRKLADDEYDVSVFQQLTRVFGVYKF